MLNSVVSRHLSLYLNVAFRTNCICTPGYLRQCRALGTLWHNSHFTCLGGWHYCDLVVAQNTIFRAVLLPAVLFHNSFVKILKVATTRGQRHLAKTVLNDPRTRHAVYTARAAADLSHVTEKQTLVRIVSISCICQRIVQIYLNICPFYQQVYLNEMWMCNELVAWMKASIFLAYETLRHLFYLCEFLERPLLLSGSTVVDCRRVVDSIFVFSCCILY